MARFIFLEGFFVGINDNFLVLNQYIVVRSQEQKCGLKYLMHTFKRLKPPAMPGNYLLLHNLTSDQEGLEAPKVRIRQDVLTVTT